MTVHILKSGLAKCGAGMPINWPHGDRWVSFQDPALTDVGVATCPTCRAVHGLDLFTPALLAGALRGAITTSPLMFDSEATVQITLSTAMLLMLGDRLGNLKREHRLTPKDRLDFLLDGIGIEVKVKGGLSELTRQLFRYAEHPDVKGILVASTRSQHAALPELIREKPVAFLNLGDYAAAGW